MASYYYPLIGGSMLASSVYHLLYYNGDILGASGIHEASLSKVLSLVRSGFTRAPSTSVVESSTNPTSSETEHLIDNSSNTNANSSTDEEVKHLKLRTTGS